MPVAADSSTSPRVIRRTLGNSGVGCLDVAGLLGCQHYLRVQARAAVSARLGSGRTGPRGLHVARRRDPEWLYFIAVTALAGLGASAWAAPFWKSPWLDSSVQFPFRLLTVMSLPLALFTGAILMPVRRRVYRIGHALGVIGLLMAAQTRTLRGILRWQTVATPSAWRGHRALRGDSENNR